MKIADLKPSRPEKDIQRAITEYLTLRRIPFSVTDAAAVMNLRGQQIASKVRKGWPDITLVLSPGRACFIECKSTKGRVRPEQLACHKELQAAGAVVIVARSVDDVMGFIEPYLVNQAPGKIWKDGKHR